MCRAHSFHLSLHQCISPTLSEVEWVLAVWGAGCVGGCWQHTRCWLGSVAVPAGDLRWCAFRVSFARVSCVSWVEICAIDVKGRRVQYFLLRSDRFELPVLVRLPPSLFARETGDIGGSRRSLSACPPPLHARLRRSARLPDHGQSREGQSRPKPRRRRRPMGRDADGHKAWHHVRRPPLQGKPSSRLPTTPPRAYVPRH